MNRAPKTLVMRMAAASLAMALSLPALAQAAEVRVISPGVTSNSGLREAAAAYTKATGVTVTLLGGVVEKAVAQARSDTPADVVVLPTHLLADFALEGGTAPGTFTPIGRVDVGLFSKPGGPRPDISTVDKLVTALRGASVVMYTDPSAGSMQGRFSDDLLKRPEFAGVKGLPVKGDAEPALKRGEGDQNAMGLGLIHDAHPRGGVSPNPYLIGALPVALQGYIDMSAAVTARAADPANAAAFIRYITHPELNAVWRDKGLDRY